MHHNKRKTMQGPPNAQQRPPASYMQRMPLSSYSFTAFYRCSIAIVGRTRNGLGDHEVAEPVFYLASRMRLNPKLSQKNALRRKSKAVIGSSLAMHLRPADPLLVILPQAHMLAIIGRIDSPISDRAYFWKAFAKPPVRGEYKPASRESVRTKSAASDQDAVRACDTPNRRQSSPA